MCIIIVFAYNPYVHNTSPGPLGLRSNSELGRVGSRIRGLLGLLGLLGPWGSVRKLCNARKHNERVCGLGSGSQLPIAGNAKIIFCYAVVTLMSGQTYPRIGDGFLFTCNSGAQKIVRNLRAPSVPAEGETLQTPRDPPRHEVPRVPWRIQMGPTARTDCNLEL